MNIDKYNRQADRLMDMSQLDYPDGSVSEILTSHMIEHVPLSEFQAMLLEWKRVLQPGGRLTIRFLNHERYIKMWLKGDDKYRWGAGLNVILGMYPAETCCARRLSPPLCADERRSGRGPFGLALAPSGHRSSFLPESTGDFFSVQP